MGKIVLLVGALCTLSCFALAQSAPPVSGPKRSRICKVNEPFAAAGGITLTTVITMNNDGHPCWYIRHTTQSGRVFGAPMHVTRQPGHGTIEITVLEKGTRIAYRPNAAFVGEDEFSIINEMYNVDRPYKVTVVK